MLNACLPFSLVVSYENLADNARLVYDRLQANQIPGIVGKLANPWFLGERENNYFAQTGIQHKVLKNVNEQPYIGPGKDLDRWMAPIDVYRKRQDGGLQVDVGDGKTIKFPESDYWKTTEIIDENAGDDIPAVAVQELKMHFDDAEVDTEPDEPQYDDQSDPDEPTENPDSTPSEAPTEEDTVNGKPICEGNQVWGDCVTGKLPNSGDFSGEYGPVCMKADGEEGSKPRVNEQELTKAATAYCQGLIDKRWLFKEGAPNPTPGVIKGVGENGADMVVSVMYYKAGCPEDKSKSELDFGNVSLETCVAYLSQSMSVTCSIGESWAKYNKDFTVMGGVLAMDCAMWTVYGQ